MQTAAPGEPVNSTRCFKIFPFPGNPEDDLTGRVFSGLEVIGYAGGGANCQGSQWITEVS